MQEDNPNWTWRSILCCIYAKTKAPDNWLQAYYGFWAQYLSIRKDYKNLNKAIV